MEEVKGASSNSNNRSMIDVGSILQKFEDAYQMAISNHYIQVTLRRKLLSPSLPALTLSSF